MTRRDYILISAAMLNARNSLLGKDGKIQYELCVINLADFLKRDNRGFNEFRFREACGLDAGESR